MTENKNKKENRSIYLYTALIFVVALVLIILTVFTQPKISNLGRRAEEFAPQATATQDTSELAKYANMANSLDAENKELTAKIADYEAELAVYDALLCSYTYLANSQITEAETAIAELDETKLTDNQRTLYNEIKTKINEGKEQ